MLKTYRLKNLLMAGQISAPELETLLQKKDYLGALYDLRNDRVWMADILANPIAAKLIVSSPTPLKEIFAFVPSKKDLLASPIARNELFTSASGLKTITADMNIANELCRTELCATEIVTSQLCRTEFFATETGLNALFNQPASLMAIWNSSQALKHIEETDTVIDWLLAHKTKSGIATSNPNLTSKKSIVVTTKFFEVDNATILSGAAGGSAAENPIEATTRDVQRKIRAHSLIKTARGGYSAISAQVQYFELE